MAKHHPDLIMCRKQPGTYDEMLYSARELNELNAFLGVAIGRLCSKVSDETVECKCPNESIDRDNDDD